MGSREGAALPKVARILIADDHALVREGLRTMLSGEDGLEVIAEAQDGQQALALCRELKPDLVLMDVRMPVMDGLEATRRIKQEMPQTSVMMVTMHENPDYLFEAVKAGAAGYVLKDASGERLLGAVRRTLEGESPLNQELAMRLLARLARKSSGEETEGGSGGLFSETSEEGSREGGEPLKSPSEAVGSEATGPEASGSRDSSGAVQIESLTPSGSFDSHVAIHPRRFCVFSGLAAVCKLRYLPGRVVSSEREPVAAHDAHPTQKASDPGSIRAPSPPATRQSPQARVDAVLPAPDARGCVGSTRSCSASCPPAVCRAP